MTLGVFPKKGTTMTTTISTIPQAIRRPERPRFVVHRSTGALGTACGAIAGQRRHVDSGRVVQDTAHLTLSQNPADYQPDFTVCAACLAAETV